MSSSVVTNQRCIEKNFPQSSLSMSSMIHSGATISIKLTSQRNNRMHALRLLTSSATLSTEIILTRSNWARLSKISFLTSRKRVRACQSAREQSDYKRSVGSSMRLNALWMQMGGTVVGQRTRHAFSVSSRSFLSICEEILVFLISTKFKRPTWSFTP